MGELPSMKVKPVKWEDVAYWCKLLSKRIRDSGYRPDVVIAIARGGFVPARLVCDYLNIVDLLSIKVEHWIETGKHIERAYIKYPFKVDLTGKRVLIVDDICDTGESLIVAREHVEEHCKPLEVKTATMQHIPSVAKIEPDFYVDVVKEWTWYMYPWNYTEDMVNLTRKIMNSDPQKQWAPEEVKEAFKIAYNLDVPLETIKEVMEEATLRGFLEKNGSKYKLKT